MVENSKRKLLGLTMVVAVMLLAGCDRIDPDSPLGKRKAIYQQMLDTTDDMGGMLRGRTAFDGVAFAADAVRLDELSRQPWQYYPEIKEDQSDARDEVWQQQARFNEMARALEGKTAALKQAASLKPLTAEGVVTAFKQVEDACEACHKKFRAY